jgi:4-hydroxy-tetrahydrodipicolinate synthase
MLTRETFIGPWAGLPVAWTDDDRFDEQTYRGDVARCCEVGMPGVYTGGTTGEFYAMEYDEFRAVAWATVEECRARGKPVMIGCSSTYTIGAARRAAYAAEIGADAIQVALPFWMEISDDMIVPFFKQVVTASGGLPFSVYETTRVKRALTVDQHRAIKDALPGYMMVKANAGTVGCTPEGCAALSQFINVFVGEDKWGRLGRIGANGCCSSVVYWNPYVTLPLWRQLQQRDWARVDATCGRINELITFLVATFGPKGFTDTAFDRLGGVASGFLKTSLRSRGPYLSCTPEDVETLRRWYREHFPEMLRLE